MEGQPIGTSRGERSALASANHHKLSGKHALDISIFGLSERNTPEEASSAVLRVQLKTHCLGITQKNGSPDHPQTQGKIERFQQTLKKWLRAQL